MADIVIERQNASKLKLYIEDEAIRHDIDQFFRYEKPGFKKNKWVKWDGIVRMYQSKTGLFPYGCLQMLSKLAVSRGWSLEMDPRFKNDITKITEKDLAEWVVSLNIHSGGIPVNAYDYQLDGIFLAIKYNRLVMLAATSAGKSYIAYALTRYYEMIAEDHDKKILIIVPSQLLCTQMYEDWKDYSSENGWSVPDNVHYIMEGRPKNARQHIYISTWQSIYEERPEYFEQFSSIICDEVHGASGDSIGTIMGNSTGAYRRIGMTGTLKNNEIHPLQVLSHFGPIRRVVTTKELIDAGRATPTQITTLRLDYPEEERKLVKAMSYQEEIDYLIHHSHRNKVIENLAITLPGNTLILFDRKEEHLHKMREQLQKVVHNKTVFVIEGGIDNEERSDIKKAIENGNDIVLLATYGTMAVGISIKKLHNLVFAHPSKSVIRILQSIGRLLRLHESKKVANIYDLIDNFSLGAHANHVFRWALDRLGFYKSEEHPVKSKAIQMKSHVESNSSLL